MLKRIRKMILCPVLAVTMVAAFVPWYAAPAAAQASDSARRFTGNTAAGSQFSSGAYVAGEVLVKFKPGTSNASINAANKTVGATTAKTFASIPGLQLVKLSAGGDVEKAVSAYSAMPGVAYAQPNYRYQVSATVPDDTRFEELWGMNNTGQTGGTDDADIDAPEAWDVATGSSDVVVAVVDTGIDYNHPDLDGNLWTNAGEIPGNGIDDDENGYIDDVYGLDAVNDDSDPMDDYGHGTHCSGTIGGEGDNALGVAGVNWDVSIMAVKTFDSGGWGSTEDIVEGIAYAVASGADTASCSWGGGEYDTAIYDAIAAAPDVLFVVAAGNDGMDIENGGAYPAAFDLDNILTVGATDMYDNMTWFSNYGATAVDVFAPGEYVLSTIPGVRELVLSPTASLTTLYSDDFSDMTDWVSSDPSHPWALTSDHYTSAPTSIARLGYTDNESSYVDCQTPLDLTAASDPWLQFEIGGSVEQGMDIAVVGIYDASDDRYDTLGEYWELDPSGFDTQLLDLSAYAGQNDIYLWFGLQSDGMNSSAEGYEGVWVDDVEVYDVTNAAAAVLTEPFDSLDAWDTSMFLTTPWTFDAATGSNAAGSATVMTTAKNEWAMLTLSEPIDLSAGGMDLSFDTLWDADNYDTDIVVLVSFDGVDWYGTSAVWGSGDGTGPWQHDTISLAEFAGVSELYIGFGLERYSYGRTGDSTVQVWLDDVEVAPSAWTLSDPDYTDAYMYADGTSMATPHVTGIAALLLSQDPSLSVADIKAAIMDSADYKESLDGLCVTSGRVNVATALLALENEAPVAADDEYTTEQDVELVVDAPGVLANDTDAEGDTLLASLATEPGAGAVVFNGDGSFVYTPDAGFSGIDSFTYTVNDGLETSNEAMVTIVVAPEIILEDSGVGVTFDRFVPSESAVYSDGTYVYGRWTGTRVEGRFNGTTIRWIGPKQPNYGMADVYIDNVKVATVDCYAAASEATTSAVLFESDGLAAGQHVISIRLMGAKNAASTGNIVVLDKFEVIGDDTAGGAYRTDDTECEFTGGWVTGASSTYYAGGYSYSRWAGTWVRFTFLGTKVAWIGPRSGAYGYAEVWIDGIYRGTVSQYGALGWRYRVWESGTLADGVHTIEIRPLGTKQAASTGTNIVVDAFDVTP